MKVKLNTNMASLHKFKKYKSRQNYLHDLAKHVWGNIRRNYHSYPLAISYQLHENRIYVLPYNKY